LTWLRRCIGNNQNWGIFADNYLPKNVLSTGGNHKQDSQNTNNPFWSDVLEAWQLFYKNINPINVDDILDEPLWFNHHVSTQYVDHWFRRGIAFIGDI
jgi:hypothetical protein